jgi:peptidoglycan/xylan/chitin deacetylase (PgdA/CDA1 family)
MASLLADAALGMVAATVSSAALVHAALSPGSQVFGKTLIAGGDPGEVALTFDDGPNGDTTLRLLDVLAEHGARATFFLIGRYVKAQPEVVRAMARGGHVVGNHTMTHPWLHTLSGARVREELGGCKAAIEDVVGERVRFFRAPHGARRPYVLRYARELGMVPVQWNVMAFDWRVKTPEQIVRLVEGGVGRQKAGSNVLLHDGGEGGLGQPRMATVEAVDRVLAGFGERGLRAVTVDAWV